MPMYRRNFKRSYVGSSASTRQTRRRTTRRGRAGLTNVPRILNNNSVVGIRRHASTFLTFNNFSRWDDGVTSSNGLAVTFALDGCRMYVGGVNSTSATIPTNTDFTTLFDSWRIRGVSVKVFFTNTTATSATTTTAMPIVYFTPDSDDVTPPDMNIIQQYPGTKSYQFGNGATPDGCLRCYVRPKALNATGTQTGPTQLGAVSWPALAWMDMATPANQYFGLKMVLPPDVNQSVAGGRFIFHFAVDYEFKGCR